MLVSAAAGLAGSALGWPGAALSAELPPLTADGPFTRSTVTEIARALAKRPFVPPTEDLPASISNLNYDQYQAIYFKPDQAVWAKDGLPFEMQLFHRGFYFKDKIEIATGRQRPGAPSRTTRRRCTRPARSSLIRCPPRTSASQACASTATSTGRTTSTRSWCSRAPATSARSPRGRSTASRHAGLALNVGAGDGRGSSRSSRAFWVETPAKDSDSIVINALLDSKRPHPAPTASPSAPACRRRWTWRRRCSRAPT
ncbi:MAG: glucan biosynthesis protein [Bauldia sp.]